MLDDFVKTDVLAPIGIDADNFWAGTADIIRTFAPRNAELLGRRDELQAHLDRWHRDHPGRVAVPAYREFLAEIGYLEPDPGPVSIAADGVDREISSVAGPQLVVPLSNARFALNATNARWGSLYDALYGSDVIPEDAGATRGSAYNPVRGERVIDYVHDFLDDAVPLARGSYRDVVGFELDTDRKPTTLTLRRRDGSTTPLASIEQFVGFRRDGTRRTVLLTNHGLHVQLVIDSEHRVGRQHPAGVADVVLEAAVTTIQDCEDSVAAVDAEDKVLIYRNWLGLMRGDLEATFPKGDAPHTRRLAADHMFTAPDSTEFSLSGRSLLLVRNVGLHMMTDAVLTSKGEEIPEGILDAAVTVAIGAHDVRGLGRYRNSHRGSIYVVKPKLHGSAETAFTVGLFAAVERLLALPENTVKLGIMDEERRTSLNLAACIDAARNRVIFINTGFLDRTGDEIHSDMAAGPMILKNDMKSAPWLRAYEDHNVDVGLASGFAGTAQIGKGMWTMPDAMGDMVSAKIAHLEAGGSCAWVPSPTAATLHAMHYHRVDVASRQNQLMARTPVAIDAMLHLPLLEQSLSDAEIAEEVSSNAQGILGYVVRWVEQGVGCSKVPDRRGVALMEDRATLRISSQHLANWLHHGVVDRDTLIDTFTRMAAIVDAQNADDAAYRPMAKDPASSAAFQAALDLVFNGLESPNGYTERVLHSWRRRVKAGITDMSSVP